MADRVLVVGGAGFVGSRLVGRLLAQDESDVVVVDNYLSSERDSLVAGDRLSIVEGSINDVLSEVGTEFDFVFHLATYHGNQSSIADPLADHEHNLLTTLNLAEAFSRADRLKKLVYASAGCTVAEKTSDEPTATAEDAPISAYLDSPYQISKVVGEFYLNYYWMRYGLPVVKARFQNVYGPGEVLGAGRWRGTPATVWRNVIPTFVYRALKGMPLVLDGGGTASRDFIFVEDLVEGLLRCARAGQGGEVYNLATGQEVSIRSVADAVASLVDPAPEIRSVGARDWDRSGRRFGDPTKALAELGFEAEMPFDDGLRLTVDWTRHNLARIDAAIARHEQALEQFARGAPTH